MSGRRAQTSTASLGSLDGDGVGDLAWVMTACLNHSGYNRRSKLK